MSSTLPFMPPDEERLDIGQLETWLWYAASSIRGTMHSFRVKDFILPLVFYKRLSDVFDDELAYYTDEYGDEETAHAVLEADHADAIQTNRRGIVRFYVPPQCAWTVLRRHPRDGTLGLFVTDAIRRVTWLNPNLKGVLDITDYSERRGGLPELDEERLASLIEVLSQYRLGLRNVEPNVLGQAYHYLVRKFSEDEHLDLSYTPDEVGWLVARLLNPEPRTTVYDPACGSGDLLIKTRLVYEQQHRTESQTDAPQLYGQERNIAALAVAKMGLFIQDYNDAHVVLGDALREPGFTSANTGLQRFDYVVASPPWNESLYDVRVFKYDAYGRFRYGEPPQSRADWAWAQHALASLKSDGRAIVILDVGAVSRGSGGARANRERDIRRALVEADVIEGVVLLPQSLFYNTPIPGILLLLNRAKPVDRQGRFLLVNASAFFAKNGRRAVLTDEGIAAIAEVCHDWEIREQFSRVVTLEEVRTLDYDLSPGKVVVVNTKVPPIFVSHSHADKAYCDAFVKTLREQGANVWYDEHNLGAGHLSSEIDQQVIERPVLVAVLSPHAFASKWVLRECTLALGAWDPTSNRVIIPVTAQQIEKSDFRSTMNGKWTPFEGFRRVELTGGIPLPPEEAAQQVLRWLAPDKEWA